MNAYLQISGLAKRFGSTCALDNVSLAIERGSVLALLGPNGAGKSTLFGCLLGLTLPDKGEIKLNDKAITDATRSTFGYVAERVSLYPQRTVAENAAFFARLKGLPAVEFENQLRRVGLDRVRERKVRQLSKGMLQRLGLAIGLCGQPELLVLDEPFNGLDPALLVTLQAILREENKRGATLLVSTHTMSAVESLATHVAILLQGKLAAFSPLGELRAEHADAGSLENIYHRIARERHAVEEAFA
ncbi:MAG: ABC transporter ATP-binding protein [Verrucomicrobiota bacterium]